MKDLLTGRRRPNDDENIALSENCNAILQRKLPPKLKDPGVFTIPCTIGKVNVGRALCDLGASINLMSLSMMKKLGCGEPKSTRMCNSPFFARFILLFIYMCLYVLICD